MTARASVSSFTLAALCSSACETTFTPPAGNAGAPAMGVYGGGAPQYGAGGSAFPVSGGGGFPGASGVPGGGGFPGGGGITAGAGFPGGGVSNGSGGSGIPAGGLGGMPMEGTGGTPPFGDGGAGPGTGGAPPVQTCPPSSLPPGTTNQTIQFGGSARSYIIHVPASYTGQTPVPLVTDFHGILLNNSIEQSISGWQAKSDQEGFIVAWPNGIDTAWNVGPCCTTSRTVDDVGFVRAVVNQIASQTCIDRKRVYAVGYSMGGGMSLDLACNAADIIAAIAPSAFDLMDASNNWLCQPSRPITMVDFRSTGDPIVPYAGGPTYPPNGLPIVVTFLGAVKTFQQFAQLDQCAGSPPNDSALGAGCQTYSQCAGGTQVTLCTKQGGGHDVGDPNVAWNVLKKYSLP
jgi:polyhydroxybutyrate depolymerase